MMKISITTIKFLMTGLFLNAMCQDGQLDNTFNSTGFVNWTVGGIQSAAYDIIIQSDQNIVLAGYEINPDTGVDRFAIARLKTNGSLDLSFGTDGITYVEFGTIKDHAYSVIQYPDGKLLVAGKTEGIFGGSDFTNSCLVRLNSDGTLDNTFGSGGKVILDFAGAEDYISELVLLPDGKILTGGSTYTGPDIRDFALMRLNADGTLDNTFGTGGKVSTDFSNSDNEMLDMEVGNDGSIYAVGRGNSSSLTPFFQTAVAKYDADGNLDISFDSDGKILTSYGDTGSGGWTLAIHPDGKIIIGGFNRVTSVNLDALIVRLDTDGSVDNTFGNSGKVTLPVSSDLLDDDLIYDLLITPDNKIIACGLLSYPDVPADGFLLKLNMDGSLDNTFDADGKVISDFSTSGGDELFLSVSLQEDGKIVTGGYGNSANDFLVARYLNSISDVLGISESDELNVYPNPVIDVLKYINPDFNAEVTLFIYSENGQLVKEIVSSGNEHAFDLSDLNSGIYYYEIRSLNNMVSGKFCKQ